MILEEYDILNDAMRKLRGIEVILRSFQTDISHENYQLNLDLSMEFLADQLSVVSENIDKLLDEFCQNYEKSNKKTT